MTFITMMINRLAVSLKNPITGETIHSPMDLDSADASLTMYVTVYAFFFIAIVQLIGILTGDRSPMQVTIYLMIIVSQRRNALFEF